MKFREHRGSLASSMETCVQLVDRSALHAYVREVFDGLISEDRITCTPYSGADDRIGWASTWIVFIKGYGVFGFTDGPLA